MKILIVEDESHLRLLVKEALEKERFVVEEAADETAEVTPADSTVAM